MRSTQPHHTLQDSFEPNFVHRIASARSLFDKMPNIWIIT